MPEDNYIREPRTIITLAESYDREAAIAIENAMLSSGQRHLDQALRGFVATWENLAASTTHNHETIRIQAMAAAIAGIAKLVPLMYVDQRDTSKTQQWSVPGIYALDSDGMLSEISRDHDYRPAGHD